MFRNIISMIGLNLRSNDDSEVTKGKPSVEEYIEEAFSDDSDVDSMTDEDDQQMTNGFNDESVTVGPNKEDKEENDFWNEEWNAIEDVITEDNRRFLEIDAKKCSVKGVVTLVVNKNEIIIDDNKRVKYDVPIKWFENIFNYH